MLMLELDAERAEELTLDALQRAILRPDGKRLPWVHLHQDHLCDTQHTDY